MYIKKHIKKHIEEKAVRVLYVDLDDTIRKGYDSLGRFVNTAADVEVFDGVADLLWEYKKLGWRIIGVSNQGGIALGHMTMQDCVQAMAETQRQTRMAFDKLLWCSHHPDAEDPEMSVCWCRKPKAGLVIEGALSLREKTLEMYPPHMGVFVGDRMEDQGCAANAGLFFVDAVEWRIGAHLEDVKERSEIERQQEDILRSTQHGVMRMYIKKHIKKKVIRARIPDETLQLALAATGVKTRNVPVCEVGVGEEIVYEGRLFTLITKNDENIIAKEFGEEFREVFFFNPARLNEGDVRTPWTVKVITDAEPTKTMVQEVVVKDLKEGDSFLYKGTLYSVDMKDEYGLTANCPGRPGETFYNPDTLDPVNDPGHASKPLWTETVLMDAPIRKMRDVRVYEEGGENLLKEIIMQRGHATGKRVLVEDNLENLKKGSEIKTAKDLSIGMDFLFEGVWLTVTGKTDELVTAKTKSFVSDMCVYFIYFKSEGCTTPTPEGATHPLDSPIEI